MGRRLTGKAVNARTVGALLVGMCLPLVAFGPIRPSARGWVGSEEYGNERRGVSGSFEELPVEGKRERDVVVLKSGDSLSGRVLRMDAGTSRSAPCCAARALVPRLAAGRAAAVRFLPEMVEGTITVPLGSVKRLEFRKRAEGENAGEGEVALVGGGRFTALDIRMNGDNLSFRTMRSAPSAHTELDMDKIAWVTLDCGPLVLLRNDFAAEGEPSFVGDGGEWVIHKGQFLFLQMDPNQYRGKAYARLRQWGRMRYVWTLDTSKGMNAGVHILASDREGEERAGSSYRVQLEYNRVAVYKLTERAETQVFFCQLASVNPRAKSEVEYNCESGEMRIWVDERQIANLRDKMPVASGEYVVLRADGRAAFDDIQVENIGGEFPLWETERGEDVVVFRNGDKVVGDVREVSEREVVVIGRAEGRDVKVEREKVWRIVFGGRASPTEGGVKGARVVFWDDNRLSGEVKSLEKDVLVVENETAGKLNFDVASVREIIFEE